MGRSSPQDATGYGSSYDNSVYGSMNNRFNVGGFNQGGNQAIQNLLAGHALGGGNVLGGAQPPRSVPPAYSSQPQSQANTWGPYTSMPTPAAPVPVPAGLMGGGGVGGERPTGVPSSTVPTGPVALSGNTPVALGPAVSTPARPLYPWQMNNRGVAP